MSTPEPPQRGLLPALGWACYLGSSWTWVIGMFLPVLLVRDYGLWGWVVFAIPNVLGAAAMGWVLHGPQQSRRVLARHRTFCHLFSRWTIALHAFALPWLVIGVFQWPFLGGLIWILFTLALLTWLCQRSMSTMWASVFMVTLLSWGVFGWYGQQESVAAGLSDGLSPWSGVYDPPRLSSWALLMFAPACVAGFTLCPYLDLTFHRARQATSVFTGRLAFTLGFGVVFLSMIVFSLTYSTHAGTGLHGHPRLAWVLMVIALFLVPQGALTVGLHLRELWREAPKSARLVDACIIACGIAVGCLAASSARPNPPIDQGEYVYRLFLLAYGVVFPAYVFLCMIPTWREISLKGRRLTPLPSEGGAGGGLAAQPRDAAGLAVDHSSGAVDRAAVGPHPGPPPQKGEGVRSKRLVFVVATLIALPMAYAGFVLDVSWWIPLSLAVLVLARLAIEVMPSGGSATDEHG